MPIIFKLELQFDTVEEATDFVGLCFGQQREKDEQVSFSQNYKDRIERSAEAARPMMEYLEAQLAKKGFSPPKKIGFRYELSSTNSQNLAQNEDG